MEVSINSYQETEEQRIIRALKEKDKVQDKLIEDLKATVDLQQQIIKMRTEQKDGLLTIVAELIKEIDGWRIKAGLKPLSTEYFEACAKDPDPETMIVKMKKP
jgi:hypothetical protein